MDAIVEEVAVIIREQTQEKNQQFVIDLSGVQNHEILCDKLRIKEILVNLLGNAVKFTPQEGLIALQIVQIPPYEKEIGHYEIHVKDTGCGMSPSFMEKMFDPFEREKNSTLSGVQGTGLGLPIVKRFVELMDGTIEAISTEGVGTEFIIKTDFLLVSRALLETTNRPSTVSLKRQIMGKRILLVEDNELNREIAVTLLQDAGFEVTEAGDGAQAVELIRHVAPDTYAAILMDIQQNQWMRRQCLRWWRKCWEGKNHRRRLCMLNQNTRKTYQRMYRIYTEEKRLPVKPGKMKRELSS